MMQISEGIFLKEEKSGQQKDLTSMLQEYTDIQIHNKIIRKC